MTKLRHSPYPSALGSAMLLAADVQRRRWDRALRNVEDEQRTLLTDLVARSAQTELGRARGFSNIRSYEDFAKHVPVGDYDSYSPYIERMRKGERGLVVPEHVRYFGNSSGSSDGGRSKFLPITERQIAYTRRSGADALMRYLAWSRDRGFMRGFTLGLFHPTTMRPEGDVIITTNPVLMVARMPRVTRPVYLPDAATNAIDDYDAKMTAIAEKYLDHDVRAVTGTTCWFPLLFERVLEVAKRRGRSAKTISEIWPNLRVLLGGGVAAKPYLQLIATLVGRDDVTLVDSYNATEGGIYATSDFSGASGMLMLPHRGTFFEFVPLESIGDAEPPRVPLWAVETNRSYAIIVTTASGLFAYKLGDIVRFTSKDPLRIEFVGRLSGCLSLTQELATHVDIEQAVAHAVAACGCSTIEFAAAGETGVDGTTKSRYRLFVEFGVEPDSVGAFATAFDDALRKGNRVYGEHRGVALVHPVVVPLRRGGAKRFMEEITRGNFQAKFPRILDETRAEQIRAHAREKD